MSKSSLEIYLFALLTLLAVALASQACGQWVLTKRAAEASGPATTVLLADTWARTLGPAVPVQGVDYGCFDKATGRECYTLEDMTAEAPLEEGQVVIGPSLSADRPQVLHAGHQVGIVMRYWMGCESASPLLRGEAPQNIRGGEGNRMLGIAQLDERWDQWPGWGQAERALGQDLDIHQEHDRLTFALWLAERSGVAQNWRHCSEVAPPWRAGNDLGIDAYERWWEAQS